MEKLPVLYHAELHQSFGYTVPRAAAPYLVIPPTNRWLDSNQRPPASLTLV